MTTELLTDPGHTRGDLRTIAMAIRKGWVIPEQLLEHVPKVLGTIAIKGKPREQIAAAMALIKMKEANDRQDERDEPPKQIEHHHTHDIGPVTETNIEAQRAKRFARLAGSM